MLKVICLRGVSGAGKSHYLEKHFPDAVVCSADHYFINEDGDYEFKDPDIAHGKCLRKFIEIIQSNFHGDRNDSVLVVDNTNIALAQLAPYYEVAKAYGYSSEIIRIVCDPIVAACRNKHGVSLEKITEWDSRFEDLPYYWSPEKVISNE